LPVVLDVGERFASMLAGQRVLTSRVALHCVVVEAALIAKDVQLLGKVGAVSPRASAFALAGSEVKAASRAFREINPSSHDSILLVLQFLARP
jgi:hypothetical protein